MKELNSIVRANEKDLQLLVDIAIDSFFASHGNSASKEVINEYISKTYTIEAFKYELSNPENIYHIIYFNKQPAGFSKIILNSPHPNIQANNVTKLERLYLQQEFYNLKLGLTLLNYTIALSKKNGQSGMWLFVWKENYRAVRFYTNTGFKVIGNYNFKLTETHANPNYQMLLEY